MLSLMPVYLILSERWISRASDSSLSSRAAPQLLIFASQGCIQAKSKDPILPADLPFSSKGREDTGTLLMVFIPQVLTGWDSWELPQPAHCTSSHSWMEVRMNAVSMETRGGIPRSWSFGWSWAAPTRVRLLICVSSFQPLSLLSLKGFLIAGG